MGRGEFVSMDVLYRIGTKIGGDFGDVVSIIEQNKKLEVTNCDLK